MNEPQELILLLGCSDCVTIFSESHRISESSFPQYRQTRKDPAKPDLVQHLSELNSEQKESLKFRSFETLKRVYDFGALSFVD